MLGVEHEHDVQQHGLFVRVGVVAAKHLQDGLGSGEVHVGDGDLRAAPLLARRRERVGHGRQARQTREQRDGNVDLVLGRDAVRVRVEGVEEEHSAHEHVHDARGHGGDGELRNVAFGDVAIRPKPLLEICKLRDGGERSREQQVGEFLVPKAVLCLGVGDQVLDVVATDGQLALIRNDHAVYLVVAVHVGDEREARDHAGAVSVAEAALDVVFLEERLVQRSHHGAVIQALACRGDLTARLVVDDKAAQLVVKAVVDVLGGIGHERSLQKGGPDRRARACCACLRLLQAVHEVEDVLALDLHGHADLLAGGAERLL